MKRAVSSSARALREHLDWEVNVTDAESWLRARLDIMGREGRERRVRRTRPANSQIWAWARQGQAFAGAEFLE